MSEKDFEGKKHSFVMENRKKIVLTGVRKVESFTDAEAFLYTELGELKIKGKKLQVDKVNVDTGDMQISGFIYGFLYGDVAERVPKNFLTKLFR